MRYAKGHKETSHERIVKAAAKRFRRDGIAATGMTGIMTEAGLTNGGFYSHFRSKNDLVREGIERALADQLQSLADPDPEPVALAHLIRSYLSQHHRDRPGTGCASAALLPEIARQPHSVRKAYTARLRTLIRQLARRLPQDNAIPESQDTAIAILAVFIGTLQLSRAVDDPALSDAMLAAGIRAATTLAGLADGSVQHEGIQG
ncbi:TetR/AcrR family transcriptional regulator [Bradyrhizobium australiense]|uniref:TetR/AcrR family transcriptional regulator n=1 Tax=Bradyrhizobium australiense TaxID=2721161 RepID=A0A7Y4GPX7_9BRAD|nr:TetR/AcrR family transcriptional regulator [Bradyrhizobium australiense]NOJ39671.1 TetR/AcrR family transcriptional regulator [Bradyrhizobium australiense]